MNRVDQLCRWSLLAALAAPFLLAGAATAVAQKITYLYPAPPKLPAFGPIALAKGKGYFKAEGLEIVDAMARGGVDVAKQVGAGNAPLGGILADGPILVRPNGVPIKTVAVFGGRGFMQLVVRADSGITRPADLKGKTISVMSYADTTYYALLGVLASAGLSRSDLNIQAAGPVGVWQLVAAGKSVGMAGVPDWIPPVEATGLKIRIMPADRYFPTMAQAIGASDKIIAENPELVRKFVRASLKGMKDIMDDPVQAAKDYVDIMPTWQGKLGYITAVFKYYARLVYPGQKVLGESDGKRFATLQDFYLEKKIIRKKTPVAELYTNQFVK
jgi:NitT/TauT family transport system substrate-binding protein